MEFGSEMGFLYKFLFVAIFCLVQRSLADEAAATKVALSDDDECTSIGYGDHVLFSYVSKFENGTAGPSLNRYHQPFYLRMPENNNEPGIYNSLFGLCENTTTDYHYDSLPDSDIRPILPKGSELYDIEESYSMSITIQKITTNDDYAIFDALRSANISLVLDLIEQHIGINAMDEYGQTPLMIAVSRQYLPVVASLLNTRQPKVDVNLAKSTGFTALFYAVEKASPSILQALLRRGADPNLQVLQPGSKGNTPLHFACIESN